MEDSHSQSDSDGLYWPEGDSQDEFWTEAVAVGDIKPGESSANNAVAAGAPTDDHDSLSRVKRTRVTVDSEEEHEVFSLVVEGKRTFVASGSDDDYWAAFPSSQINVDEPTTTQPSFIFSGEGSRNTSMTSMTSSSSKGSLKRKRTYDSLPAEIKDIACRTLPSWVKSRENAVASASGSSLSKTTNNVTRSGIGDAIIAYDRGVQELMDRLDIAWGAQYEIARAVSDGRWRWSDVTEAKLKQLTGNNKTAVYRLAFVMAGKPVPQGAAPNNILWEEMDREQAAILENKNRGLGLQGTWQGTEKWYGGRIQQVLRITRAAGSDTPFTFTLEKMQMTRSHRFGRFSGSRRIIQCTVDIKGKARDSERERTFLNQSFILCGRTFVPFSIKDSKVYLVEINKDHDGRLPLLRQGDQHRWSLEEFVAWHNPMELNSRQPVMKWTTRFDLGLSTTVPALRFEPENIAFIDDVCADHEGSKVPTEKIFTDGCGYMNRAALREIALNMGYADPPTAVQGRIFGSKGLWVLHPLDHDLREGHPPKIWIRPSQQKIRLVKSHQAEELNKLHPAHFIFDLVAPSRVTLATRLSRLTVLNLAHNGVPKGALIQLMKDGLDREISPLTQWEGPNAMMLLWHAVNKTSGSSALRLQQFVSGSKRAMGLSRRREGQDEAEDSDEDAVSSSDLQLNRCFASGKPLLLGDSVLNLLRAGFNPMEEEHLYDELRKFVDMTVSNQIKRTHIPVLRSADAFIVPDPYGILQEDEIHFASSQPLEDPLHSLSPRVIVGDVLLYRNPARLPSDVRKVKAVSCAMLQNYTDVIVLPIKGPCSLASILAGGDVDGDVAICIWDPSLVAPFRNPPVVSMTSDFLGQYFEPENEIVSVSTVYNEMQSSPDTAQYVLRHHLLSGLAEHRVGIYSHYHENVIYATGYDHEETIRLAFMFNVLLDARKTGYAIRPDVLSRDKRDYDRDLPPCMSDMDPGEFNRNPNYLRRAKGLPRFILEELLAAGKELQNFHLHKYDSLSPRHTHGYHRDVSIVDICDRYFELPIFQAEVPTVKSFIEQLRSRWAEIWAETPLKRGSARNKDKKISDRQKLRAVIAEFMRGPDEALTRTLRDTRVLDAVMASYAYKLSPKFGFTVAFTQLTSIKAQARGSAPTCASIAAFMTVPSSAARVLALQNAGDA